MKLLRFILIINILLVTVIVVKAEFKSDFDEFINLFAPVKLPISTDTLHCSKTIIPQDLAKKFIIPHDSEAGKADEIKCIGMFQIKDNYIGVLYCYWTGTSGDVKELMVFDKSGNYMSEINIWIDYRTYYLTSTIDASFNIKTQSYGRENVEEVSDLEYANYSIINGIIVKKK